MNELNSEMDIKIFEFAYELALRDATIRTAYKGNKDELRKNRKAKSILKKYIDGIINGESTNFDTVASDIEQSFENYVKPKKDDEEDVTFTFGNTQKLINMTVKYMYITTYNNEELRDKFKVCHCPLDTKMREEVLKQLKALSNENDLCEEKRREVLEHIKALKECNFSECAWSRIDKNIKIKNCKNEHKKKSYDIYDRFQAAVKFLADKQGISPIEFDYQNWLPDD